MLADYSGLAAVIVTGIVIFSGFIVASIFKTLISFSFIGFVLSLYSYFVCDYYFYDKVPVIACISFILCLIGVTKSTIIKRVLACIGLIVSIISICSAFGIAL